LENKKEKKKKNDMIEIDSYKIVFDMHLVALRVSDSYSGISLCSGKKKKGTRGFALPHDRGADCCDKEASTQRAALDD